MVDYRPLDRFKTIQVFTTLKMVKKQNNNSAKPKKAKKAKSNTANTRNNSAVFQRRGPTTSRNKGKTTANAQQYVKELFVDESSDYLLFKMPMSCKDLDNIRHYREMYQYYTPQHIQISVKTNFSKMSGGGYMIGWIADSADTFDSKESLVKALSANTKSKAASLASDLTLNITTADIAESVDRKRFHTDASESIRNSECGDVYIVLKAAPSSQNSSTLDVSVNAKFLFSGPTIKNSDSGAATRSKTPDTLYQIKGQKGMFLDKTLQHQSPSLAQVLAIWPELAGFDTKVVEILEGLTYSYNHGSKDTLKGRYFLFDSSGDGRACYFMPIRRSSDLKYVIVDESVDEIEHYQVALSLGAPYQFSCDTIEELNALNGVRSDKIRRLDIHGYRTGDFIDVPMTTINAPAKTRTTVFVNTDQINEQTDAIREVIQHSTGQTDTLIGELEETLDAEFAASRAHSVEQNALTQAHITAAHVLTRDEAKIEAAAIGVAVAGVGGEVGGVVRQITNLSNDIELKDQMATSSRNLIFTQVDGHSHKEIASLITGKTIDNYDLLHAALETLSVEYNEDPDSDNFRDSLNTLLSAFQLPEIMPTFDAIVSYQDLKTLFSNGRLFPYHGSAFADAVAWPNFYNLGTSQFPLDNAVGLYIRTQYNDVLETFPVYTYLKIVGFDGDALQFQITPENRTRTLVNDWNLHYSFETIPITSYRHEKIQIAKDSEPRVKDLMINGNMQ